MDNQAMLKTAAFGGFDKKSVLDYIYQLNESAKAEQDKLEQQVADITLSRDKLSKSLQEAEDRLHRLEEQSAARLKEEQARTAELSDVIEGLEREMQRQEQLLSDKDAEFRQQAAQHGEIAVKYAQLEKTQIDVERAATQVGKLILTAKADAEKILEEARGEAEAVRVRAGSEAREIVGQAKDEAESLREAAQRANESLFAQMRDMRAEVDRMSGVLEDMVGGMRQRLDEITRTIDSAQPDAPGAGADELDIRLEYDCGGEQEDSRDEEAKEAFFRFAAEH